MRRLLIALPIGLLVSCHQMNGQRAPGIYETRNGSQILVADTQHSYLGTKYTPPGTNVLRDYGMPIKKIQAIDTECSVYSNLLTFTVPTSKATSCNGFVFRIKQQFNSHVVVHVECRSPLNATCSGSQPILPDIEYEYAYIPGKGVVWIRFVSENPKLPGDVLLHQSGSMILGLR